MGEQREPGRARIAVHPKRSVVAVAVGCEIRFLDVQTGTVVKVSLREGDAIIRCLAFSAQGTYLAVGGDDKIVTLYSTGGQGVQKLNAFVSPKKISCLAFTHDEAYVVAANKFGDVLVAPTAPQTGSTEYEQFVPLMGHFCSIITSVGMSSLLKPQLLSTSDRDGRIRVSVVPEEPMKGAHEIQSYCFGHTNFVSSAVFLVKENKDEVLLSGSGDGTMKMWDPMTGQCIQSVVITECGIVPHDCDDANGLVVLDLIPSHDRQSAVALIDGTTTCIHVSLQHGTFTMKPIKLNLPVVSDAAVDADGQYWFVGGPIGQNGVQCVRGMISSEGEWTEIPTAHDGYSEFEARTEGDEPLSLCHLPKYLFRVPFSDGDAP